MPYPYGKGAFPLPLVVEMSYVSESVVTGFLFYPHRIVHLFFLSLVDVFDRLTFLLFSSISPASLLLPPITTVLSHIPKKRRLLVYPNFLSRGRGYCLFFIRFFNLLVWLLRISRSPYV